MGTGHRAQGTGRKIQGTRLWRKNAVERFRSFLFVLFLVPCAMCHVPFLSSSFVFAEDVSFEATVDSNKIAMGTAGQLVLTIHGTQDVDKIALPPIDGMDSRYVGPSTQVKVINGTYSTAKAFTYMLLPLKEGTFTIPPVEIEIKGQVYRSQPITLSILPASSAAGQTGNDSAGNPQALADRVRMLIFVPRTQCFVNEELPFVVKLYVQDVPMQDITLPDIHQEGFVLSEYPQPKQYEETLDGRKFHVVEFATRITPFHPGKLNVGPAVINANLVFKTSVRRNPFGQGNSFNDDFFANFFGGYEKKPVTITARPVVLDVADLPADGLPKVFSGAVGRFTFDAAVSPAKVKVGDPLTLRLVVTGVGNLKGITMPSVKDERFKVYEPQIKEEDGKKTLEQVLIPTKEDIKEVPAVDFSYFDVESGKYQTITRGPFPVEVGPPEKGQEFQAIGFADKPVSLVQESFGKDIVFIKDHPGTWYSKGNSFSRQGLFYAVFIVFLNIWIAVLVLLLHRRRLTSDTSYARRAVAYREFRLGLKNAARLISANNSREFYDALMGALRAYLVSKLKIASGETSFEMVEAALRPFKVDEKEIRKLKDVWAVTDQVLFGGLSVSEKDMKRDYLDTEEVADAIERRVR